MGFYIRKAFKSGPVRLNLSKGGLGLSGGVTGARVGINTRGLYVHGGRHGLYYRKYLKQQKRSANQPGEYIQDGRTDQQSGIVYLFRDTGATYSSKSAELKKVSRNQPALPSSELLTLQVQLAFVLAGLFIILFFITSLNWIILPALILAITSAVWIGWNSRWKKKSQSLLEFITERTEQEKQFQIDVFLAEDKLPERWKKWLNLHLHAVIGELAMRHEEIDTVKTLKALDEKVKADTDVTHNVRASILGNILDEMLEDHLLSIDEELAIRLLLGELNLPDDFVTVELERLEHYSHIRREISRPFQEIDPEMPLVRGEIAFEVFDRARLLNERVLNRFQRDNVQYREVGYEIDAEGKLILTDRRLMLIDRGTSEYRLNRIVDVTADPETGIVEIVLSNRKSPVLITVEEPLLLAARLEKILEKTRS